MSQHYQMLFQSLKSRLPGAKTSWIAQLREEALTAFLQKGFPTTRDEDWRYTSLRAFEKLPFASTVSLETQKTLSIIPFSCREETTKNSNLTAELVFLNGQFLPQASTALPAQIRLLAPEMDTNPDILMPFLNQTANLQDGNVLMLLNTAFMQNGAFIEVPKSQHCTVHLVFLTTSNPILSASYWRNIIILRENATATVIETYWGDSHETYLTNTLTEVCLSKNAVLTHYKRQQESKTAFHFGNIYVDQPEIHSEFNNHTVSLGGKLSRSDIHVALKAPKTQCLLNGLYQLGDAQHADHHTTILHQTPQSMSREFYKGTLDASAHGVFNGKVFVEQDAQKTDSIQYNHNLLLSEEAKIDTKPQLEILADDVKCIHGATVGQLDQEALFYLKSRGLDEKTARQLLIQAFFTDIIERMPDALLKKQVKQCLS